MRNLCLYFLITLYSRARTVRIGKWRWPPAKEDLMGLAGEGESGAEGFFEFKMRKMQERKMREEQQELQQHHPNQSEQDRRREEDENDGMLAM